MWLFAWILTTAAPAQGEPAAVEAGTEVRALRSVIEDQITAFRAEDAQAAWRVVAPGLQEKFGTADRFLQLVRDQYPAVYAPRSYEFGAIEAVPGGLGQWLDVRSS